MPTLLPPCWRWPRWRRPRARSGSRSSHRRSAEPGTSRLPLTRSKAVRMHFRHLSDPFDWLRNERDHQCHCGHVKCIRRKRKRHSISPTELGDACCRSGARKGKLALGWINSLDLEWRAAFHEQLGESAIAAANVDPFQIRCGCQPIKKDAARSLTPIPHHPLIRGPVLEADLSFTHQCASFRDFTGKSGKVKTHSQSSVLPCRFTRHTAYAVSAFGVKADIPIMSAIGTKRTYPGELAHVRFRSEADMARAWLAH